MVFELLAAKRAARLTGICGLGERGGKILSILADHLNALPEGLKLAIATATAANADELVARLAELRERLSHRETVEAIERSGWSVEGREGHRVELDIVVVGTFEDASDWVQKVLERQPPAYYPPITRLILLCSEVGDALEAAKTWSEHPALELVGPRLASGLTLDDAELPAAAAGMLLARVLPEVRDRLTPGGDRAATFGAAGYYGLVGPSRDRLADRIAQRLIHVHLAGEPVTSGTRKPPAELDHFIGDFSPEEIGLRLFDPRLFDELHMEPIPAKPEWTSDHTLAVRLDRAAVALELAGSSPRRWSHHIRVFSRGFDMSVATIWRQKLERAASALHGEIAATFIPRFRELLGSLVYAPAYMRQLLKELRRRLAERRQAMTEIAGDLEAALARLDAAVAARPNVIALAARMLLWVAPAVVAGTGILFASYPPARARLFSVLLAGAGVLLVAGWVVGAWSRARRRLYAARDRAIDVVFRRQETIVSENAIGYLGDLVVAIAAQADSADTTLAEYCVRLEAGEQELLGRAAAALSENTSFSPVLVTPDEYARLYDSLGIDEEAWLTAAVDAGLLAANGAEAAGSWLEELVGWCGSRLTAGIALRRPSYHDLWTIRRELRGESGIAQAISQLWRRAEPLSDVRIDGTQETVFVVPSELITEARGSSGTGAPYGPGDVVEASTLPVLLCVRRGRLPAPPGGSP